MNNIKKFIPKNLKKQLEYLKKEFNFTLENQI